MKILNEKRERKKEEKADICEIMCDSMIDVFKILTRRIPIEQKIYETITEFIRKSNSIAIFTINFSTG